MREHRVKVPELAIMAVTRGMIGFGAGLLAASQFKRRNRRKVGGVLLAIGALSTIPLAIRFFRQRGPMNGVRERDRDRATTGAMA